MQYKVLPRNLRAQTNNILNKNERLATNIVAPTPSSTFDKSHRHITTFNSSKLIPIYCEEVLPGDIFNIDCNTLIRLATPAAATMENPVYDIHFYYIPNRILWEKWKNLMGESKTAGYQQTIKKMPVIDYSNISESDKSKAIFTKEDFASYLGFPINVDMRNINVPINSLYFKAYCQVWNDYYRDQNLQNELDNTNNSNPDSNIKVSEYIANRWNTDSIYQLGKGLAPVSKLPDYFTTCLPWPQKGETLSIGSLPLQNLQVDIKKEFPVRFLAGGQAQETNTSSSEYVPLSNPSSNDREKRPIRELPLTERNKYFSQHGLYAYNTTNGNFTLENSNNNKKFFMGLKTGTSIGTQWGNTIWPTTNQTGSYEPVNPNWGQWGTFGYTEANVKNAGDIVLKEGATAGYSVNDLRLTLALQHMLELDARGGTRYTEILLNHFGISASNARLDRAEFIGGFRDNINISNVVQSSSGVQNSPLGVLGGVSVTSGTTPKKIEYASEEHGIIMGFVIVRPQLTYWQGLDKKFTRVERFDYYDPQLANIGEQPVWKYELYLNGTSANNTNNDIFGFNEAWADYRYSKNRLSGELLPNNQNDTGLSSLYVYTEYYNNAPTLNAAWMISNPNTIGNTLLYNYTGNKSEYGNSQFLADFYFNVQVSRKMPVYSIPGLRKI